MSNRAAIAACVMLLLVAAPGSAGLILKVTGTTIPQGGTGTVDVTISSSDGTDVMSNFNIDLLITGPGGVSFDTQTDPYAQPSYVFFGNSASDPAPFFGSGPYETNYPDDSLSGGDSTLDASNESIATAPAELLAKLYLKVAPAAPLGPSTISLLGSSLFQYDFSTDLTVAPSSTLSDTITVTAAVAAIPEPSTFVTMAGIGLAFLLARRRRVRVEG